MHTMHKYVLEVVVKTFSSLSQEVCLPLQDTTFIAVSTYHNLDMTQLKVQHNPCANRVHHTVESHYLTLFLLVSMLLDLHLTQLLPSRTTHLQTAGYLCLTGYIIDISKPRMYHYLITLRLYLYGIKLFFSFFIF